MALRTEPMPVTNAPTPVLTDDPFAFSHGGGAMGQRLRAYEWSAMPLGHPATWPASLRTAVSIVLNSQFPSAVIWGPDLITIYNDAFKPILGAKPEALGRSFRDIWSEAWDSIGPIAERAFRGEATFIKDFPLIVERNGYPEQAYFTFCYSPVRDESGVVAGMIDTVIETTESVRDQQALRQSEERLRALVNATSDVVYRMSPDWSEMRQLYGRDFLSDTESVSKSWLADYIHPDDQPPVWEAIQKAIRTRSTFEMEHRVRQVDGTLGWTLSRAVPILGADGTVCEWFGVASNVTARKEAEAALRESEERFRLMANAVPAIAWITDAEGGVEFFNRRWADYTGAPYDPATDPTTAVEVIGTFVHPDDAALTAERFDAARRTGGTYLVEHRLRSESGDYRWFLVRGEPYRDPRSGEIVRWFGASTDIHDRKSAEGKLRAARDAAEEANRSKSRFLAAASHDLRQPMQSLLLFLDVLKPHVAPAGQGALKHLGRGLDALRDLLDSLLDISRLDAGIVVPKIEDFPIAQVAGQIGAAYMPIAAAKGLTLQVDACPVIVRSDPTLLGRILRNLVENALRYTEAGRISIQYELDTACLRIEVHDTGIGIPPEHLERIWEEFHQVDNPERDRNRGLGLGLAIVQRLSTLLEHPVTVRSAPSRGSVFSIAVPLGRAAPLQAPELATGVTTKVAGKGRFAVLVDDDAIVLLGLTATFESWGYDVLAADSADRALAALTVNGRRPDVVVSDYRLREGRNGTDAILRVREAYGADIPGIILTGETGAEVQKDAAKHTLGIIHKPVTPRQLGEALDRILTPDPDAGS